MGLHLYAITRSASPPSNIRGIDDSTVQQVEYDGLVLIVSEHDAAPAASMDAVRAHNAVVVSAMTPDVTPVPVRFGQYFSDAAAAVASVSTSHEKWCGLLDRFAGAVEYGVRIFDPATPPVEDRPPAAASAGTGTAYLEAIARRRRGPEATIAKVGEVLERDIGGLVREQRSEPLRTEHGVLSVAHLLHASNTEPYRAAMERVRAQLPHLRLLSSGPWPPYSFVQNDD